jgi:hypothetical protein
VEKTASFAEVLEAADQLPLDDQEILADVLHRRVVEERRKRLVGEVREAREEYEKGQARPTSPDELMAELLK